MSTSKGLTEIGQDGFARSRMLEGKWMTDSNNEFVRYLGQFFLVFTMEFRMSQRRPSWFCGFDCFMMH